MGDVTGMEARIARLTFRFKGGLNLSRLTQSRLNKRAQTSDDGFKIVRLSSIIFRSLGSPESELVYCTCVKLSLYCPHVQDPAGPAPSLSEDTTEEAPPAALSC